MIVDSSAKRLGILFHVRSEAKALQTNDSSQHLLTCLDEVSLPDTLPPVVITAFTRPDLLERVLESIAHQTLEPREVLAFIDGPRNEKDLVLIEQCIKLLESFATPNRDVKIVRWPQNLGCDKNVITSFTKVFETYESLVYIEDDDWVNLCFYDRVCRLLEAYKYCPKIFSVSGYASLAIPEEDIETDFFLSRRVFSWGFGIWRDRWQSMDLAHKPAHYNPFGNFYQMPATIESKMTLVNQFWLEKNGKTDWVITMTAFALFQDKFHLIPKYSIVKNIGFGHEQSETYRGKEAAWVNARYERDFVPSTLPKELRLHERLNRELKGVELAQFLDRKNIWLTPKALFYYLSKHRNLESWYHLIAVFLKRLPTLYRRWKTRLKK